MPQSNDEAGLRRVNTLTVNVSGAPSKREAAPSYPKVLRRDVGGISEEIPNSQNVEQRQSRQKTVEECGWASDIHQPYRPLGVPDLNRREGAPDPLAPLELFKNAVHAAGRCSYPRSAPGSLG